MVKFIPVQCQDHKYPSNSQIKERSANFFNFFEHQKDLQKTDCHYLSLHTDHCYRGPKKIFVASQLPNEFPSLSENVSISPYKCMSKLWLHEAWSKEFASFIVRFTEGIDPKWIKIIEIHPPFDKYCNSLNTFIDRYAIFEEEVSKKFPTATICIENRYNNRNTKRYGNFILSTNKDIINLEKLISDNHLKLTFVVDVPQLFSEHYDDKLISEEWMIEEVLAPLSKIRDSISGTHIWGKTTTKGLNGKIKDGVHNADLTAYFKNEKVKRFFLREICKLFDDGKPRHFLPEVFSKNDEMSAKESIESIVSDFEKEEGVEFLNLRD